MNLKDIYTKRPFKTRNADEFDLSEILKLFVNPLDGLTTPFDYENSIVKGRMGSGKTMYLRANHAYYIYSLLPSLENGEKVILPVLIRLSDFQHISEPSQIYRSIIVKIVEELASIYEHLQNVSNLGRIHMGMRNLVADPAYFQKMSGTLRSLVRLGSEEYVERVTSEIGLKGGAKPGFFELSTEYKQTKFAEVKTKPNPGIKDIQECYLRLFSDSDAKILLLIDEAGALDKKFFKNGESQSFFEVLMNQFRTSDFIRTKIALYPHSYSDILTETRYGDVVRLEENIYDRNGYEGLRKRTLDIVGNYISEDEKYLKPDYLFDIGEELYGDAIEQIIYASNGNIRRLIQLLDTSLSIAYAEHKGESKVSTNHAINALKKNSQSQEDQYSGPDREFLQKVVAVCKNRSTFRFQFPYMSPILNKYTNRSQETNVISILEIGVGRKSTTYAFDYSFCVSHDIPTHYLKSSEKIDKSRSLLDGEWITRTTSISEDVIEQGKIPGKIEGSIDFISDDGSMAFIEGNDGNHYATSEQYKVESDADKNLTQGLKVLFYPVTYDGARFATSLEIL